MVSSLLFYFTLCAIAMINFVTAEKKWNSVLPDPDVGLDMVQIVETRGYEIETYYATTSDGYILTMFRIPHGKHEKKDKQNSKPVCLLQHGLLDSSYTWVNNFENQSLAYILADAGYDVWFGNNRGNRYGRNHTSLDPDDGSSMFWDFSWDEMALYDVPAMISLVAENTGANSIAWIGHSEGTIQMFAAASEVNPTEDQVKALDKVKIFVALAPVAYVGNLASKVLVALAETPLLQNLYDKGVYEILPYGPLDVFASQFCQKEDLGCDIFLMAICGPSRHLNQSRIQVYVSQTPAGSSTRNLQHWQQGILLDTFQKYDFGSDEENFVHYGQSTPPMYELGKLRVTTALFSGGHDYLADPMDVRRILDEAPPDKIVSFDETDTFAHLDFTWGYDANVHVYRKVLNVLKEYML